MQVYSRYQWLGHYTISKRHSDHSLFWTEACGYLGVLHSFRALLTAFCSSIFWQILHRLKTIYINTYLKWCFYNAVKIKWSWACIIYGVWYSHYCQFLYDISMTQLTVQTCLICLKFAWSRTINKKSSMCSILYFFWTVALWYFTELLYEHVLDETIVKYWTPTWCCSLIFSWIHNSICDFMYGFKTRARSTWDKLLEVSESLGWLWAFRFLRTTVLFLV